MCEGKEKKMRRGRRRTAGKGVRAVCSCTTHTSQFVLLRQVCLGDKTRNPLAHHRRLYYECLILRLHPAYSESKV